MMAQESPIAGRLGAVGTWLEAFRVQHWTKSGFCVAALFFHGSAFKVEAWLTVLPIVLCFSLVSSAVYLVNDIVNREEDRRHPRKRKRPIASGRIALRSAWVAVIILAGTALGLAWWFYHGGTVVWVLIGYYFLSWIYSFFLRSLPLIDVLVLALGFVARVAAGSYALQSYDLTAHPTVWLLSCTYCLALLLGFGKRKGEWLLLEKTHRELGVTRKALRGYTPDLLDVLTGCSALFAGGIYLAYCLNRPDRIPFVFSAIPALTGLMSYLRLAWRSTVVETPERLLLHSPGLVISLVAWLGMVAFFTALQ
ncbi:MAG: UbiA prenyltransferase family protein [Roseibacillus sp.]|jgi:4-hydroxybenzoate polyprenyltransferase